ncbi:hypothetical protein THAOC_02014, partial [Thalassiosira oceanica]
MAMEEERGMARQVDGPAEPGEETEAYPPREDIPESEFVDASVLSGSPSTTSDAGGTGRGSDRVSRLHRTVAPVPVVRLVHQLGVVPQAVGRQRRPGGGADARHGRPVLRGDVQGGDESRGPQRLRD